MQPSSKKQKVDNSPTKSTSTTKSDPNLIVLDGESLTIESLIKLQQPNTKVTVPEEAWKRIEAARGVVETIVKGKEKVYGINTGFGNFANVQISQQQLDLLQENLIRSHAIGTGQPISPERTRLLLALRINVLAKGRSGISTETVRKLIDACNHWCLSYVPEKGTVGASGDLAPLAHLALGLMGEGKMWDPEKKQYEQASEVLKKHKLAPLALKAKEGLALINGTQFISALGSEALQRAQNACIVADVASALSLEALKGTVIAYAERIHKARPHAGQLLVAHRLRCLLHSEYDSSEIAISHKDCGQVQDSYTLRCVPQVHGICNDTVKFVQGLLETEINSATDNPMVFSEDGKIVSGGNFHGEYPAKSLDYLAIGINELANISERRTERLVNSSLSNLPPFLIKDGGLNSGFMMVHVTAAALTSENKVLVHPASSDTISTSAAKEDHVSMGGWAARKALQVVENVETVLAIEILAACQAIDLLRPLKSTKSLEKIISLVRTKVPTLVRDRYMVPDLEAVVGFIRSGEIAQIALSEIEAKSPHINHDQVDDDCA